MNVVREVLEKAEWSSSTYVDMVEPEDTRKTTNLWDGARWSWYECTAPTFPDHLARVGHREGCKWVQAMSEVEFPETEDPGQ